VAIYRGRTIATAKLVAVSADPVLVGDVATRLLRTPAPTDDPVVTAVDRGRRAGLRIISREAADASR